MLAEQFRLARLEDRVSRIEDHSDIERLQYQYGYYIDNRLWSEIAALFCDEDPSIEIGQRGRYIGKQRIGRFLADVLGGGRSGLLRDEIIHHIQLQLVITIDEDRQGASARGRALVQGNSPPGSGRLLLAEGIYENRYVRQGDGWRIKSLWWVPTYYFQVAGFDAAVFDSGPPSESFPPDLPSVPIDARLGRRFPPFHYPHPTTDAPAPASVASPEQMPAASAKAQA